MPQNTDPEPRTQAADDDEIAEDQLEQVVGGLDHGWWPRNDEGPATDWLP